MDEEQLAALRRWGEGLRSKGRDDEVRAAGKAIVLLCDEVDRLEVALWHERTTPASPTADGLGDNESAQDEALSVLRRRLREWAQAARR